MANIGRLRGSRLVIGAVAATLAVLVAVIVFVSVSGRVGLAEAAKGVWSCTLTELRGQDEVWRFELTIADDTWEMRFVPVDPFEPPVRGTWSIADGRLSYAMEGRLKGYEIAGVPDSVVDAFSGAVVNHGGGPDLGFEITASDKGRHIELVNENNQTVICDRQE